MQCTVPYIEEKAKTMTRIDINDPNLTLRDRPTNWGAGVSLYNGIPFTGIMYEFFDNSSQLQSESEYKDGILHGRQVVYWQNGQLKEEYFERYGGTYGTFKVWNEQGVLITDSKRTNEGVSLWHKKYDNQGVLISHWIRGKKVL